MNLHEAIDTLALIANTYADLVEALANEGWENHGDKKEHFLADPYRVFGASRYFMKDGQLHLVSTDLNIRDSFGESNIVSVSLHNLALKEMIEFESIDINHIDDNFIRKVITQYNDVAAVNISIMDNEDDMSYFMGLTGDGRAIFERRSDEDRLRPIHETRSMVAVVDCDHQISPLAA